MGGCGVVARHALRLVGCFARPWLGLGRAAALPWAAAADALSGELAALAACGEGGIGDMAIASSRKLELPAGWEEALMPRPWFAVPSTMHCFCFQSAVLVLLPERSGPWAGPLPCLHRLLRADVTNVKLQSVNKALRYKRSLPVTIRGSLSSQVK